MLFVVKLWSCNTVLCLLLSDGAVTLCCLLSSYVAVTLCCVVVK